MADDSMKWLIANIDRMKVADLTSLCHQLCSDGLISHVPAAAPNMRIAVRAARSKYWDMKHNGRWPRRPAIANCITAAECNEWLRTLPPPPLWPDTCQCLTCVGGFA